jgi:GT2 family glycosyltransferase
LGALKKALKEKPKLGIAGARLLNQDGSEQRGARRGVLSPWAALVSMTGLSRLEKFSPIFADMHWEGHPLPKKPKIVPAISGACMMLRSQDFEQISGFDERYFLHVEDLDICRRIREKEGNVLFVPAALITHYGSTSQASIFRINWNKATGLVRYFYRFSQNIWEKLLALVLSPLIVTAMMLRTVWIKIRD